MHQAVTNGIDFFQRFDATEFLVGEQLENCIDRALVVSEAEFFNFFVSVKFEFQENKDNVLG